MFLEISQNSQENTWARVFFLITLQAPVVSNRYIESKQSSISYHLKFERPRFFLWCIEPLCLTLPWKIQKRLTYFWDNMEVPLINASKKRRTKIGGKNTRKKSRSKTKQSNKKWKFSAGICKLIKLGLASVTGRITLSYKPCLIIGKYFNPSWIQKQSPAGVL